MKRRLTYANVMSTLAFVVAVGGGTALAIRGDARSVDGVSAEKVAFVRDGGSDPNAWRTIAKIGGLKLQAVCFSEAHNHLYMRARSTADNAEIVVTDLANDTQYFDDDDFSFDEGDTVTLPSDPFGSFTIGYVRPSGSSVTGVYTTVAHGTTGPAGHKDCVVGGTLLYAPK